MDIFSQGLLEKNNTTPPKKNPPKKTQPTNKQTKTKKTQKKPVPVMSENSDIYISMG